MFCGVHNPGSVSIIRRFASPIVRLNTSLVLTLILTLTHGPSGYRTFGLSSTRFYFVKCTWLIAFHADSRLSVTVETFFLRASAMLKHVVAIGWTSVRLSAVRHTLVLYQNGSTYRQTVFTSMILVFWGPNVFPEFQWNTQTGMLNAKGVGKVAISDQYLAIARKRLKIDGYMQRGVSQALNPLSNRVTFTAIVPGAYPG